MRFRRAAFLVVSAAFVAACGGGGGNAGSGTGGGASPSAGGGASPSTGGGASPSAPAPHLGAPAVKLPFGGDVCKSLTAADFPSQIAGTSGWTLTKTEVGANLVGDAKAACLYDLTSGNGSTSAAGRRIRERRQLGLLQADRGQVDRTSRTRPFPSVGEDAYLGQRVWPERPVRQGERLT